MKMNEFGPPGAGHESLVPLLPCIHQWKLIFRERNKIPKIDKFYEVIVPKMAPRHFRRYFRMYTDTLNSIISYLALQEPFTTLLDKGRVCRHKKVAMTCAYLGSKQTIMQYVVTFLFYLLIFFFEIIFPPLQLTY